MPRSATRTAFRPDWEIRIRSELRRGERLIWVGQPRPGYFARQALGVFFFGGLWTVFTSFMLAMFLVTRFHGGDHWKGDPVTSVLGLSLFMLVGIGLLSVPFWLWRKARHTYYALTDRRAILWEAGWFGSVAVRSYLPDDLNRLYRVEYHGGGDLIFEEQYTFHTDNERGEIATPKAHGFIGISNVREVEEILRRTLLDGDD